MWGAFAAICAFGLGKSGYNIAYRETINDAKVTTVEERYVGDLDSGYEKLPYPRIFINKYSTCLDYHPFFSKKEISELKKDDQFETIIIQKSVFDCDYIINYKLKERKKMGEWGTEIEYLINKSKD